MNQKIIEVFDQNYGDHDNVKVYFAPGRVNLIGEHTDYNGGHVFPCALTIGTYCAARTNNSKKLRFYSMNFESVGLIEVPVEHIIYKKEDDWTNYPKGVLWAIREAGYQFDQGLDLVYYGNIPTGSGLSSSASIEVLTAYMISELGNLNIPNVELAVLGRKAENEFVGLNCGIMDQFAIAMGKENHAIFLDTDTLEYSYAPIQLDGVKIVIACSNKKRSLVDSKYNERRSECETALSQIQTLKSVTSLGELTIDEFEQVKEVIKNPVNRKRAKHAVYENQRTIEAIEALNNGDIKRFGELMNESHISLRDDYEVTGIELDTLVEAAWQEEGVIGSRMTGAGFGGCTVSLVKESNIESFIEHVGKVYEEKIGYSADFYVVEVGNGPHIK